MKNTVCFHNPDEVNGYLSNWYLSDFTVDGICFSSMEQYMMYRKAAAFDDAQAAQAILETDDVAEIKALGRSVRNYNDRFWSGIRQIVVYNGLLEKFSQNAELKNCLLGTGNALLAECALKDRIWGNGCTMTDPDRFDPKQWMGQNLLGYSLMMVREHLHQSTDRSGC